MKDQIDKKEFSVKYCPTERMIADFYSKPTQGALFKNLSSVIMGEITLAEFNNLMTAKERVGGTKSGENAPTKSNVSKTNKTSYDKDTPSLQIQDQKQRTYAEVTKENSKEYILQKK